MTEAKKRTTSWRRIATVLGAIAIIAAGILVAEGVRSDEPAEAAGLSGLVGLTQAETNGQVESLAAAAPAQQKSAFRDEQITLAEYRDAATATTLCIEAAASDVTVTGQPMALTIDGPTVSNDEFAVTYGYTVDTKGASSEDAGSADALAKAEVSCQHTYLTNLEQAYKLQWRADEERVAASSDAFAACLEKSGIELRAVDATDVVAEIESLDAKAPTRTAANGCLQESPAVGEAMAWERGLRPGS